jgi:hypothetical protein
MVLGTSVAAERHSGRLRSARCPFPNNLLPHADKAQPFKPSPAACPSCFFNYLRVLGIMAAGLPEGNESLSFWAME